MDEKDKEAVVFLKEEASRGHLEVTVPEISRGLGISYVDAIRLVERLQASGILLARERGTQKRASRFIALAEIVELCRTTWAGNGSLSATTKRVTLRSRSR